MKLQLETKTNVSNAWYFKYAWKPKQLAVADKKDVA